MGRALREDAGPAFCRHQPARIRAGDVSGQSADRPHLPRRGCVGRGRRRRPGGVHCRRSRRGRGDPDGDLARADRAALRAGLYGYNGALVGLALATFLAPGPALWVYVALGGSVSTVATLGTAGALKPLGAPALTFPFVAVTWILLLATYGFAGLSGPGCRLRASWPRSSRPRPCRRTRRFRSRRGPVDRPGLSQGERRVRAAPAPRPRRQLCSGRAAGARRGDPGGGRRARIRRGKRCGDARVARLQPGADRGRARRDLPKARTPRRPSMRRSELSSPLSPRRRSTSRCVRSPSRR